MQKKIFEYMKKWNMLLEGSKVLIGFSGGADSTALLQLLWEYEKEHRIKVMALHVNHGIRGVEAKRDQTFCEMFCKERGIPFQVVYKDVLALAKKDGISTEEAGRYVRYTAFEQELSKGTADLVALAHHQNDQAETMLFHLMRGTGIRGLRGMEPVRMPYIRPLLCVTRQEIVQWLIDRGITWVEDSTNQELDYTRNQIRHRILAPMEEIRAGSTRHMAETANRLLETEDYLKQELAKVWNECVKEQDHAYAISLNSFEKLHTLMQKMLVLSCIEKLLGSQKNIEAVHIEQVCALRNGQRGSRITLPNGCYAVLGYEELILKKGYGEKISEEPVYCTPDAEYHYMGNTFRFSLEIREKNDEIPVNCYTKWFDYDKIKHNIILRTRQPGDYLEISGGAHKKLKDYLINGKIPREERDQCILLADGNHIIWIVGMRISERYKVTDQTRQVLKVHWIVNGGTKDGEASY